MGDEQVFEKISKTMNTTFLGSSGTDIEEIEAEIKDFEQAKTDLVKTPKKELVLQDKEYLNDNIKEVVVNGKDVLEKLQKEIKIGSSARMYEVYAKLMDSVLNGLRELRDLSKMVFDTEMFGDLDTDDSKTNININVDGRELIRMIKDAQNKNELNKIDADFTIEAEENPHGK